MATYKLHFSVVSFILCALIDISLGACEVEEITVQPDFNASRYEGVWLDVSWIFDDTVEELSDLGQRYQLQIDGSFATNIWGRELVDDKLCISYSYSFAATDDLGKYTGMTEEEEEYPFWIIETDYTSYAVVYYGCTDVDEQTGECFSYSLTVKSRSGDVTADEQKKIDLVLQRFCLTTDDFSEILHDNACTQPDTAAEDTVPKFNPPSTCKVADIKLQENFDPYLYQGEWFEISTIVDEEMDEEEYLSNLGLNYTLQADGSLDYDSWGRQTDEKCTAFDGSLVPDEEAGKYTNQPDDYQHWVIETDYDSYAVIYGCAEIDPDSGLCLYPIASVHGRNEFLSDEEQQKVYLVLERLCLKKDLFTETPQDNPCPLDESEGTTISSPPTTCRLADNKGQEGFTASRYQGVWREVALLAHYIDPESYLSNYEETYVLQSGGDLSYSSAGRESTANRECVFSAETLIPTAEPGIYTVNSNSRTNWIIETDYDTYSVQLQCLAVGGGCLDIVAQVWARDNQLTPEQWGKVDLVLQRLCMTRDVFTDTPQDSACPPYTESPTETNDADDKPNENDNKTIALYPNTASPHVVTNVSMLFVSFVVSMYIFRGSI